MLLIAGVVLWSALHFIPVLAIPLRKNAISSLGEKAYAGIFSAGVVISVALMVIGWRAESPEYLYSLPEWSRGLGMFLMLVSFVLFGAAHRPTVIKRYIRHPMLSGMLVWSVSHLMTNGDHRSLILFGGLGLWAIVQIIASNHRDGPYQKPQSAGLSSELRGLLISFVIFIVVAFAHRFFTGVSLVPHG